MALVNTGELGVNGVKQEAIKGNALVSQKTTAVLGAYEADKTTAGTSTREAIPSGAQAIRVSNESTTIAEAVRFLFGDSTVVALATSGYRVRAAGTNVPPGDIRVEVPMDATHWAYIAEAGTPNINVVWEF